MDVWLTDEERMLRETVRSYLDTRIAPIVAGHERDRTFPWDRLAPLYDLGYVRGVVPAADGGDEAGHMALAILMEEAGRCWGRCVRRSTCRPWWPRC